jgi:hypothetical protein
LIRKEYYVVGIDQEVFDVALAMFSPETGGNPNEFIFVMCHVPTQLFCFYD